ncbi:MAG: Aminomethyltransferase folate-binding domain [Gaiellales bacterium]|jgi:glycine cleavage system aminomethyltransferase T|nr:Aminomethyltransferase folate-binding domain [Gaiellales bacterium]
MEYANPQSAVASVPQIRLAARAILRDRDGHAVVAHYGSVPGEIAVCMKSVGLIDHSDYGVLELRGDRELLDQALGAHFGDPPLPVGSARSLHAVWYLRLSQRRTLLVGPHAALASWPPIARADDRPDLAHRDLGASLAIVGVLGPRAARLLAAAGLPGKLAVGGVGTDVGDNDIVAILRESQRRYLAIVPADAAETFWARLLIAGAPLGAAFVGRDALALLDASQGAGRDEQQQGWR